MFIYLPKVDVGKHSKQSTTTTRTSAPSGRTLASSETKGVWRLPCSRGDIFQSKLLGAMEKRQVQLECSFSIHVIPRQNWRGDGCVLLSVYAPCGWLVNEIPAALPGLWADEKRLESVDKKWRNSGTGWCFWRLRGIFAHLFYTSIYLLLLHVIACIASYCCAFEEARYHTHAHTHTRLNRHGRNQK